MKICLIEPFHTGSHAAWAEEYARYSRHEVDLLTLPGRYWKWRMHGGAVTLANRFMDDAGQPDLLLATDMLDLTTFLALTRKKTAHLPTAIYFHENQLTYPWSPQDSDPAQQRDVHYAFINYVSALTADKVLFNSRYHLEDFHKQLPGFLKDFPDHSNLEGLSKLKSKSHVLPLGLDLRRFDDYRPENAAKYPGEPTILWNHRWEYDKNPEGFFQALYQLQEEGYPFKVVVLGESYRQSPAVFSQAQEKLGDRVLHIGFAENISDYAYWLWRADILPVTSNHDFFGASTIEAIYCGCLPLLPKRLAYPEHIPEDMHEIYLYEGHEELLDKLRNLLEKPKRMSDTLSRHVTRYDWLAQINHYDTLMENLVCPSQE